MANERELLSEATYNNRALGEYLAYAIFAARFNIPASVAYILPALFERSAEKANMPVRALLSEATYKNRALGEYLAYAARKVAAEDRAAH